MAITTAILGLLAAKTANDAYRLESAPVIVVTRGTGPQDLSAEEYVLSRDSAGHSTQLRRRKYELDEPIIGPGATLSPHYGGRPNWPRLTLQLRNVGRSPAIQPEIEINCILSAADGLNYENLSAQPADLGPNTSWVAGRDYPFFPQRANEIRGSVRVPVVPANDVARVTIENRLAANVEFRVFAKPAISAKGLTTIDGTSEAMRLAPLLR